ncbi:hypothetical protein SK128_026058 [Halocaridina rubra]|uniref:Uncharacterized protein n=1 Tax=Halocaridina rubra TaxID=373956 RepID=A0AAN9A9M4_HALRR
MGGKLHLAGKETGITPCSQRELFFRKAIQVLGGILQKYVNSVLSLYLRGVREVIPSYSLSMATYMRENNSNE